MDKILAMTAGRELDVSVRKHVFKSDVFEIPAGWAYKTDTSWRFIPHYSTDISAAWEVEETVMNKSHQKRCEYIRCLASVTGTDLTSGLLHDISLLLRATPEQRCKAALLAVMEL